MCRFWKARLVEWPEWKARALTLWLLLRCDHVLLQHGIVLDALIRELFVGVSLVWQKRLGFQTVVADHPRFANKDALEEIYRVL